MSSENVMKKISIQTSQESYDTRDIAIEAQNGYVSYDNNNQVITNSNKTVASTKSIAKTIKDINTNLNNKAVQSDLDKKANIDSTTGLVKNSELPDEVTNVVEGYYKKQTDKFYADSAYTQEIVGKIDKVYIDKNTNLLYNWNNVNNYFVKIKSSVDVNLEDLDGININDLQDGDSLVYDSESEKWINKMSTIRIIPIPDVKIEEYTFNGSEQGPTITGIGPDFYTYVEVDVTEGEPSATDAGTYTFKYKLKNEQTTMWGDLTTSSKPFTYTINKAEGLIDLDKNKVELTPENLNEVVNFQNATGVVTASSSDRTIATVSVASNTLDIQSTEKTGTATITVNVAASQNYKSATTSIAVTANFVRLVSWSTGTDEEISKMVQAYYNGTFTLTDIQRVWHVGDEREVSLSAIAASQSGTDGWTVGESHRAQTVKMVILDFDHDTLTISTGGKTKALVTLGQKDCLRDATITDEQGPSNTENGYMNSSNTNVGGWTSCARRAWCNNGYYNALPSYLKTLVKPVNKLTSAGNSSTTINTNSDKVFLPSEIEIFGTISYSVTGEGTQYSYYTTASNRYKLPKWISSGVSSYWWERSPFASNTTNFCAVDSDGNISYSLASRTRGVAPSCCI